MSRTEISCSFRMRRRSATSDGNAAMERSSVISLSRLRRCAAVGCAVGVLTGSAVAAASGPAGARSVGGRAVAHASHTLSGTDTARLHLVRASGSELFEEGTVSGGLSGRTRATVNVGATFSGSFTFYLHGGSISGHGTATPHGSGRFESFSGTMTATRGTGRYAHVSGHGGMYGTFDRRTYAVVIQTTGTLHY